MTAKKCPDFRRAAAQRLIAAEFLFRHAFLLDALYLGGYVVECSLKALILARTPRGERAAKCTEISSGNRGHDFEFLKAEVKRVGCPIPRQIVAMLGRVSQWSTSWRYAVGLGKKQRTKDFLDAARSIMEWTERS